MAKCQHSNWKFTCLIFYVLDCGSKVWSTIRQISREFVIGYNDQTNLY